MLKAVIFDMDGVLVDSEPMHYEADRLMLLDLGIDLDYDYYKQFIGSTNTYMWTCIKEKFSIGHKIEELTAMADDKKQLLIQQSGYRKIPGVPELLRNLSEHGFLMAVASSSPHDYIEQVIGALELTPYFNILVSGESVKNPKPSPDVFLKAAMELGVHPDECIVFEDSENGSKAAAAAGMACIGYLNPGSGDQNLILADYLIEGYEEIDHRFVENVYKRHHGFP